MIVNNMNLTFELDTKERIKAHRQYLVATNKVVNFSMAAAAAFSFVALFMIIFELHAALAIVFLAYVFIMLIGRRVFYARRPINIISEEEALERFCKVIESDDYIFLVIDKREYFCVPKKVFSGLA